MESITYFNWYCFWNGTILVCLSSQKKKVELFFSRSETGNEEGRVEEIELSSRTNSYIDVVQNNAETDTDADNESVVDAEGVTQEEDEDDFQWKVQ